MARLKTPLAVLALTLVAAPAMALGITFDLPRLTFPQPPTATVTQTCTGAISPATCPAR